MSAQERVTLYPTDYYDMEGGCTEVWQEEYPDDDPLDCGVEYTRSDLVPQWQPIETAPKDGLPFLALGICGGMVHNFPYVAHWQGGRWSRYCMFQTLEPTHWMPLPEPPEE